MIDRGRNQYEAVEPVQPAAVARNANAEILDADVAFDRGENEVAELAEQTNEQPELQQ